MFDRQCTSDLVIMIIKELWLQYNIFVGIFLLWTYSRALKMNEVKMPQSTFAVPE